MEKTLLRYLVCLFSLLTFMLPNALADTSVGTAVSLSENKTVTESAPINTQSIDLSAKLASLELEIREKSQWLEALVAKRQVGAENEALEAEITELKNDIVLIQRSFEQVAIGGISLDIFKGEEQAKDWQEELTLVVKPLLENLRSLTEKPRKQENLKRIIAAQDKAILSTDKAITSIDNALAKASSTQLTSQLLSVKEKWIRLRADAQRQKELAVYELQNLNGENVVWYESVMLSIKEFTQERGLTLMIALLVAISIYYAFKLLRLLLNRNQKTKTRRTASRVLEYAQRLLTVILIVIGVMTVFFIRGDILLLALSAILILAAVLGLKNLVPQFIAESRLLLNLGGVRENEMVIYNGVPWRVASINLYSKLINPRIQGTLRLPLAYLKDLVSRPITEERWFPSVVGDWVMDGDGTVFEVLQQTPDNVELQSAQSTNKIMPTSDYFSAGYLNLTRSKKIRIVTRFGLDYGLQALVLDEIPEKLQTAVQERLEKANFGTSDITTRVEFESAGSSSLDFIVIVHLGAEAAKFYQPAQRLMQQACVDVCNREGWTIPFPQLTVSKAAS